MGETTFKIGTTHNVSYTGTAGNTSAVAATTSKVRVWCTTDAFVAIGTAAVATAADMPVAAYTPEYFDILPGQRASAIQQSTGGIIYITQMRK